MEFEVFQANLNILDKQKGDELRKTYIAKFIDTNDKSYKKRILKRHEFCDGYCYLGYLWDYLKKPVVIGKEYLEKAADGIDRVYVFWDIHSCERIFIKNYWRFGKTAVLSLPFKILLEGAEYLPEDIYIFDETMSWTLITTHEDIDGECYYLKSGEI